MVLNYKPPAGDFDLVDYMPREIEILGAAQATQVGGELARAVEQHAVPVLQRSFRQAQLWLLREM